jgi:hypothetical protein
MLVAGVGVACSFISSFAFAKEREKWLVDGVRAAQLRCEVVARNLKDLWLYYDNFEIYKIAFSVGLPPVDTYWCTISATHVNIKDKAKQVRVEINQRTDSDRFTYRIVQPDGFPECREELLIDCDKGRNQ